MGKNEEVAPHPIPTTQLHARCFFEYHNLTQQNSSVEQFIADFDRLRMRCEADEDEEQVVVRFLGALHPEIADVVQLQQFWTLQDVCHLALKVEKQQKINHKPIPVAPHFSTNLLARLATN